MRILVTGAAGRLGGRLVQTLTSELKRIDRLVEFDEEVWVLDYKLGESEDVARHRAQMQEYRSAMQTVYAGKTVRCALVFGDGALREV